MKMDELFRSADIIARKEIEKYGLPTIIHYELSLEKAQSIALKIDGDVEISKIGTILMDLKLGQAFKEKKLQEHVAMSHTASKKFLQDNNADPEVMEIILNCVEAHHGTKPFKYEEAEVCANADCYRFLHPKGVFSYYRTLVVRINDLEKEIRQIQNKMDEKMAIISIPFVVEELTEYYNTFKRYFSAML